MPGAGSCLSLRDFVCQHCRLRSPGPQGCPRRHRGFAALCGSSPAASAALPPRSPAPLPSPACLLPQEQPSPQLLSPGHERISPTASCRHQYFPTAALCLPTGPACSKVKTSHGRERLCSISPNCRVEGGVKTSSRGCFQGQKKAEERVPTVAPIPASPGDGESSPPLHSRQSAAWRSRVSPPSSPSPPRKKEGWPGAPYLEELPRFYILLLPFVKFQMETSNISRGNQPNIGQRVKSKRMAELVLSLSLRSLHSCLYIYIYIHTYIYIYVYIIGKRGKKIPKRNGGGEGEEGRTFGVSADRQVEEKS